MKCLNISLEESQIPYVLHAFKITQAVSVLGSQEYYGFCESDLARLSLGIKEKELKLQRKHTPLPKCPFCIHSGRL